VTSLRKKYRVESDREAPPVSTPPSGHGPYATQVDTAPASSDTPANEAAPKFEEADAPKPSDPGTSPAEKAAQSAIKERLADTQRAHEIERESINQRPQYAEAGPNEPPTAEQIIANSGLPERAKTWLRQHPEHISDLSKNNTLIALHDVAKRQAGSEFSDMYFERMDDLLGLKPATQYQTRAAPAPRNPAPVRQQYTGGPVSAPPSREVPSYSTGRPSEPMRLTAAERADARTFGISDEAYLKGKQRLAREKAAGMHGNG
jgi:hypothetical protein